MKNLNQPYREQIIFEQIYDGKDYILRLKRDEEIIAESKNERGCLWCLMKVLVLFEQGQCGCNCTNNITNVRENNTVSKKEIKFCLK